MLKKLTALAALLAVPFFVDAQGTVNFETSILGTSAQIRDSDGTLASGFAYQAQLYAADGTTATQDQLRKVGIAVPFRAGGNAGYVAVGSTNLLGQTVNKVVTVTEVQGGPVSLQVRAWAGTFASYEDAVAAGGRTGFSNILRLTATGFPPATPPNLTGLQGFQLVPEPSTIALGVLGLGSLLLFRRRKA